MLERCLKFIIAPAGWARRFSPLAILFKQIGLAYIESAGAFVPADVVIAASNASETGRAGF
jgi:hypothetical protein